MIQRGDFFFDFLRGDAGLTATEIFPLGKFSAPALRWLRRVRCRLVVEELFQLAAGFVVGLVGEAVTRQVQILIKAIPDNMPMLPALFDMLNLKTGVTV